MDFDKLIV